MIEWYEECGKMERSRITTGDMRLSIVGSGIYLYMKVLRLYQQCSFVFILSLLWFQGKFHVIAHAIPCSEDIYLGPGIFFSEISHRSFIQVNRLFTITIEVSKRLICNQFDVIAICNR